METESMIENGSDQSTFQRTLLAILGSVENQEDVVEDNDSDRSEMLVGDVYNETELVESIQMERLESIQRESAIQNATKKNHLDYIQEVIKKKSEDFESVQLIKFRLNDDYNIQDDCRRIHVGHSLKENVKLYAANNVKNYLKPHQIGGIRFMIDNIIAGSGCILAHEMGLGKTVQVILLCDVLLRNTEDKRILCVVPINTLENWRAEFNLWLPNYIQISRNRFQLFVINEKLKTQVERSKVIFDWQERGGVLAIGYELFRSLSQKDSLARDMYDALLQADVLVCDEGHRLKNENSKLFVVMNQVNTTKRIILTGYPLQNHLKEYYNIVNFVRPQYLSCFNEFASLFMLPIENGHFGDATDGENALMLERAYVLNMVLRPVVQRRANILQNTLPEKFDFVIPVGLIT